MENRGWIGALQKFQPSSGQGAQSAGNPGMGGGPVPYAPGATNYRPTQQVQPQQVQPAQQQLPQGAGNPAPQPSGQQGQVGQAGQLGDPQRAIMIAEYLMRRLQRQMDMGGGIRRG